MADADTRLVEAFLTITKVPRPDDKEFASQVRSAGGVLYEQLARLVAQMPKTKYPWDELSPQQREELPAVVIERWLKRPPNVAALSGEAKRVRGYLRISLENRARDELRTTGRTPVVAFDDLGEGYDPEDDETLATDDRLIAAEELETLRLTAADELETQQKARILLDALLPTLLKTARSDRQETVRKNYALRIEELDGRATFDEQVRDRVAAGSTPRAAQNLLHKWDERCLDTLLPRLVALQADNTISSKDAELLSNLTKKLFHAA